jgi:hypothetical protein
MGIFPNDASIGWLGRHMMLECGLNRRYMPLDGLQTLYDADPTQLPAVAR